MCTAIPPSRGVAPGPAIPFGKVIGEAERASSGRLLNHARQPGGQPVGDGVVHRPEAAVYGAFLQG